MYKVIRYATPEQYTTAVLLSVGRKWAKLAIIDHPVRTLRVSLRDLEKYSEELPKYKPKATAKKFIQVGKRLGINKGTLKLLREVANNG